MSDLYRHRDDTDDMTICDCTYDCDCHYGGRCPDCEQEAELLRCEDCGATAMVIDCGHMPQPRQIAGGRSDGTEGSHTYCDECAAAGYEARAERVDPMRATESGR